MHGKPSARCQLSGLPLHAADGVCGKVMRLMKKQCIDPSPWALKQFDIFMLPMQDTSS